MAMAMAKIAPVRAAYVCAQCTRAAQGRLQFRGPGIVAATAGPRRVQTTKATNTHNDTASPFTATTSEKKADHDNDLAKSAAERILSVSSEPEITTTSTISTSNISSLSSSSSSSSNAKSLPTNSNRDDQPEPGRMSARLQEATEDILLTGGRAGRKAVMEEAGFSEELKERLFAKLQDAKFKAEHSSAFAEVGLSDSGRGVGSGGRGSNIYVDATNPAWTGTERVEDGVLRMLEDAHKPLRGGSGRGKGGGRPKMPDLRPVDLRLHPEAKASPGQRLAEARERAMAYTGMDVKKETSRGKTASEDEREAWRAEFRERFKPASRTMPATLQGLASLANERIEDAIARGQFKNIPRGKGVVRDTRSDNPFIDTTEYIMNKMIKQQNIVPPWIDKQQELAKAIQVFRARLRDDWRRHAARSIAAKGGSLEEQIRRARGYAMAEEVYNPVLVKKREEQEAGKLGLDGVKEVTVETLPGMGMGMAKVQEMVVGEMKEEIEASIIGGVAVPKRSKEDDVSSSNSSSRLVAKTITTDGTGSTAVEGDGQTRIEGQEDATAAVAATPPPSPEEDIIPLSNPFRDPAWLALEKSYMELSIANINGLARAYNLMAPELAKKPYYSLERELNRAYADVAPQLAETIRERATRPRKATEGSGISKGASILDRFGMPEHKSKVYDSKAPHYGFKEMWRDLFGGKEATK